MIVIKIRFLIFLMKLNLLIGRLETTMSEINNDIGGELSRNGGGAGGNGVSGGNVNGNVNGSNVNGVTVNVHGTCPNGGGSGNNGGNVNMGGNLGGISEGSPVEMSDVNGTDVIDGAPVYQADQAVVGIPVQRETEEPTPVDIKMRQQQ